MFILFFAYSITFLLTSILTSLFPLPICSSQLSKEDTIKKEKIEKVEIGQEQLNAENVPEVSSVNCDSSNVPKNDNNNDNDNNDNNNNNNNNNNKYEQENKNRDRHKNNHKYRHK